MLNSMTSDHTTQPEPDCGTCPLVRPDPAAIHLAEVSRRDFVSVAMLSAIAVTLSACGGGDLSAADRLLAPGGSDSTAATPTTPSTTPTTTGNPTVGANQIGVTIASYAALANVGGIARISNSPPIALARTATGFVAYSLRCPHEGTTVSVISGSSLRCSNHGALFASTGGWSGGYRTSSLSGRGVTSNADKTFVVVNLT